MAVVLRDVEFLNNPARFSENYRFNVTFECPVALPDDLEWKLVYVSCPDNESLDQELESICVGPVPKGTNRFEFDAKPPEPHLIPPDDVLGVAALIFTGSYKDQEFVRAGYYQNTEYDNEEMKETPPAEIRFERLVRDISTKPRVTRFQIKWDVATQQTSDATGAANSAPVPSADDLGGDDNNAMQVEPPTTTNGTAAP